MGKKALRTLEVECLFKPSATSLSLLRANNGNAPFHPFGSITIKSFKDTYFDRNQVLEKRGIWVRQRNGEWQAKCSRGGEQTNLRFEEFTGTDMVKEFVRKHIWTPDQTNFGSAPIAEFRTERTEVHVDKGFIIAIDETDFGHMVGEVELLEEVSWDADLWVVDDKMRLMGLEIDEFMSRHGWAFPDEKAVGKVAAYLEWKKAEDAEAELAVEEK
ncbi:hypothetical protein K402DRAFT_367070 [Aulographum hederae CBS 113979]|uniref:CYTH domain-containing protein n=1 Tax=Aulographum hederae CBS 113979 TaxID=1176131 RepID=A0A6G1HFG1_9PEZI|nr:hypothetical protein K402DRAFT_367070 [Aulographum hederae CBS 113979]